VFPPWKAICDKYDVICEEIPKKYSSKTKADQKEESIHWEQTAFELMILLLLGKKIPFETTENDVQKIIKTEKNIDKEIDFSIRVKDQEIYFGATSFNHSEKDISKDFHPTSIEILDIRYSDGTVSEAANISSLRSHSVYLNRRLAVRVAKEGKHELDSDYVYIVFPKSDAGFGGGLDAISKDFSFSESSYTYPKNGITGLILIGEHINIQAKKMSIEHGIWLVKTIAFSHSSPVVREMLSQLNNITIDMRPRFQEIYKILPSENSNQQNSGYMT
jgi:hypothetical protein